MFSIESKKKKGFLGLGKRGSETSVIFSKTFFVENIIDNLLDDFKKIFPEKSKNEIERGIFSALTSQYLYVLEGNNTRRTPPINNLIENTFKDLQQLVNNGGNWNYKSDTQIPEQVSIKFNEDKFTLNVGELIIGKGFWKFNNDKLQMSIDTNWHKEQFTNTNIQKVTNTLNSIHNEIENLIRKSYEIPYKTVEENKNQIIGTVAFEFLKKNKHLVKTMYSQLQNQEYDAENTLNDYLEESAPYILNEMQEDDIKLIKNQILSEVIKFNEDRYKTDSETPIWEKFSR
jgi:ElaB/YqjD/DUF883 family membrane-anchored ribosome-binding protein